MKSYLAQSKRNEAIMMLSGNISEALATLIVDNIISAAMLEMAAIMEAVESEEV